MSGNNFAEKIFKVGDQRSRSYVYKCVNVITAEAYISTACCFSIHNGGAAYKVIFSRMSEVCASCIVSDLH